VRSFYVTYRSGTISPEVKRLMLELAYQNGWQEALAGLPARRRYYSDWMHAAWLAGWNDAMGGKAA
jgi:ribosome modulation factor